MCYVAEACRNYALFHEAPLREVSPARVSSSFGGLKGWASVTRTDLFPECIFELEDLLKSSRFSTERLDEIVEGNKRAFQGNLRSGLASHRGNVVLDCHPGRLGGDGPPLVNCCRGGAAWEETLRWSLPTFSLAKEGYERFKGLFPGQASLQEVFASSAGVEGWQSFARTLTGLGPLPPDVEESDGGSQADTASESSLEVAGGVEDEEDASCYLPGLRDPRAAASPRGAPSSCS